LIYRFLSPNYNYDDVATVKVAGLLDAAMHDFVHWTCLLKATDDETFASFVSKVKANTVTTMDIAATRLKKRN